MAGAATCATSDCIFVAPCVAVVVTGGGRARIAFDCSVYCGRLVMFTEPLNVAGLAMPSTEFVTEVGGLLSVSTLIWLEFLPSAALSYKGCSLSCAAAAASSESDCTFRCLVLLSFAFIV